MSIEIDHSNLQKLDSLIGEHPTAFSDELKDKKGKTYRVLKR